jgi:tight adherence protein C
MNLSDKSDNEKMLADIENVYDVLRIQTKAGVYITSVLTDCYLVVRNKRLKSAFLKLTSDIAAKNDIESALNDFKSKFRNEYIDTLVIIVKQSMQTGQASKIFDDIREQIADIDAAMLIAEKERINRQIITVQLILYFAIIAVAVFITYISLISGLSM